MKSVPWVNLGLISLDFVIKQKKFDNNKFNIIFFFGIFLLTFSSSSFWDLFESPKLFSFRFVLSICILSSFCVFPIFRIFTGLISQIWGHIYVNHQHIFPMLLFYFRFLFFDVVFYQDLYPKNPMVIINWKIETWDLGVFRT